MSELQDTIKSNGLANLKKGDKVLALHFGFPIEAELLEKPRNHVTLVMLTNADKFGLLNEHGSIRTKNLKSPEVCEVKSVEVFDE
tara:strand:+ start:411 stop:665 length:255 start_codon:yes stop_codon:yes gene_type:complete